MRETEVTDYKCTESLENEKICEHEEAISKLRL